MNSTRLDIAVGGRELLTLTDLVFESDIARLPRTSIEKLARALDVPVDLPILNMASKIWDALSYSRANKAELLSEFIPQLFAGRTSVGWFTLPHESFPRVRKVLTDRGLFDPPIKEPKDHMSEAALGAAETGQGAILLRCLVSEGKRPRVTGTQVEEREDARLVTVIFEPNKRLVEVRASGNVMPRMASFLADLLKLSKNEPLSRIRLTQMRPESIEELADQLGGQLIEALSIPHEILQALIPVHEQVIDGVFAAIDSYFRTEDLRTLEQSLEALRGVLLRVGINPAEVPFLSIVLAGLERIGIRATYDVRTQPLFSALRDYTSYRQGWIRFPFVIDGVQQEFTIRIGLTTDTVYFLTPATESVIEFTRDVLLRTLVGGNYNAQLS